MEREEINQEGAKEAEKDREERKEGSTQARETTRKGEGTTAHKKESKRCREETEHRAEKLEADKETLMTEKQQGEQENLPGALKEELQKAQNRKREDFRLCSCTDVREAER